MVAANIRHVLLVLVVANLTRLCFAQQLPLSLAIPSGQSGVVGRTYNLQLSAKGGRPPYEWRVSAGRLPPGLQLNQASGLISGVPTSMGDFRFSIQLSDSAGPRAHLERELVISISGALTVNWRQPPQVEGESIKGTVIVDNQTGQVVDLTVIVLAVNEVGKAFALGYQRFDLQPGTGTPVIPFGSSMPFGSYIVHVDAIGESANANTIYRARTQTQNPLVISQQ